MPQENIDMKAVVIDAFGPSSNLQLRNLPRPQITADQILVEVHAAGINPIDWKIGEGLMSTRYGKDFPMIMGFDASGVVAEIGANVTGFRTGDEVYARSTNGPGKCYAEFVALDPDTIARKPVGISHIEAAAMPLAALTALNGLRDVGQLRTGQRVLINGAVGGVGIYAVQIAKILDAHVTGVCGGSNLQLARELGADETIDYHRENPLARALLYDVIYDTVGTLNHEEARQCLTADGIYLTLVPAPGIEFFFPGKTLRTAKGAYFLVWTPTAADLQLVGEWAEAGKLRPVIDSVYPLEQIQAAHERSRTLHARGKIVVRVK
jgi:NADPH:quinone reductase-like Zn-dependent oxidoreductase